LNKAFIKKALSTLGKTLGVLGLLFIFYTLSQEYTWESFADKLASVLPLLPLLFLFNILSIMLGIYAWHFMLLNYASDRFAFIASYYYFCKTEIAKYLPGNVFHFIGRQALASKVGISQIQMGKTSLLFSLLLLASTVIASTFFALFAQGIANYILGLMLLATLITLIAIVMTYKSFPMGIKIKMNILLILSVSLQGIMLASIVEYQQVSFELELFLQCTSIYIISWLIGFVTPGASGGLGVREGTFVAIVHFLHLPIASEIIIFSVLLVRLVNILTDILLYLSTFMLKSKINIPSS
jgi:hypothetical protein